MKPSLIENTSLRAFLTVLAVLATAVVLTPVLAKGANALTLNSPNVAALGTDSITCSVTNVGTTPINTVTVTILDLSGAGSPNTCNNLAPNDFCPAGGGTITGHCRVTATASKSKVRAEVEIDDVGGNTKVEIPFD